MTPQFWIRLLETVFSVPEKLAVKLWRNFDVTPVLLYQIGLCDTHDVYRPEWVVRMKRLGDLLSPAALLAASLAVSPENGRSRPTEITAFEEKVLRMTDRRGQWRWELTDDERVV